MNGLRATEVTIASQRYTGAITAMEQVIKDQTPIEEIGSILWSETERENFQDKLDDIILMKHPTRQEQRSIQQHIGKLQALDELYTTGAAPTTLKERYQSERVALANGSGPINTTMWGQEDRDKSRIPGLRVDRGYALIDELSRKQRNEENAIYGTLSPRAIEDDEPVFEDDDLTYEQIAHVLEQEAALHRPPMQ